MNVQLQALKGFYQDCLKTKCHTIYIVETENLKDLAKQCFFFRVRSATCIKLHKTEGICKPVVD